MNASVEPEIGAVSTAPDPRGKLTGQPDRLGSAINVLTIVLILILLTPSI